MSEIGTIKFKISYIFEKRKNYIQMKIIITSIFLFISIVSYAGNQVRFIQNRGQWKSEVQFMANVPGGSYWLEGNQITYDFIDQTDMSRVHGIAHGEMTEEELADFRIRHHSYRVIFEGANENINFDGKEMFRTYNNYFLGSDPEKWAGHVPLYGKIAGKSLYNKIDLITYSVDENLKSDFIVHPGGKPGEIQLKYEGIDSMRLIYGELLLKLSVGDVYEHAPKAYQIINNRKTRVKCEYELDGNRLSFSFPKGYNPDFDLIIDPELVFSTYTGSTSDNWGFTATYGEDGTLFGGGIVFTNGYPVTIGAWDSSFSGGNIDIGITHYSADGSELIYSTYLGGGDSEAPHSLMMDNDGNLVVMGSTGSTNFPVTDNSYSQSFNGGVPTTWNGIFYDNGSDIYITKFSNDGSQLLASTYVGGASNDGLNTGSALTHNYGDEARGEVFIDDSNRVYVASCTQSVNFPTTSGSQEQTFQGVQDGCAFSLSSDFSQLTWSTYLGGSASDAAYSIKVNENIIQIAGGTTSQNFPTTSGSLHPDYLGGVSDGFVAVLDTTGSISDATFIGTDQYDQVFFLDNDSEGNIFCVGQTGGNYPVTGNVYSNVNGKQFIQKLSPELNASLLSTKFGSSSAEGDISITAFLVDKCNHVYVAGWGGNLPGQSGNTFGLPVTPDAYQLTTDGTDFYFIVFGFNLNELLYATYFGGNGVQEHVDGGTSRFDKNGAIYEAVCAGCGGSDLFPTTSGAWSNTNGSTNCNLGTLRMDFNFQDVLAIASVNDTSFCGLPPFDVQFYGSGTNSEYHFWDFGDGSVSTETNPVHSYNEPGAYPIVYILTDSSTCNISDTAYASVTVTQEEEFDAEWNIEPPLPCSDSLNIFLAFTGTGADSLIWDMGDGTFFYNDTIVSYTYHIAGVYQVSLTAFDFYCNNEETRTETIFFDGGIAGGSIEAPNVFSPNDDGTNEGFYLFYPDEPQNNPMLSMLQYHISIFNRWGKKVFESGDNIEDWIWDGKINGKPADEGVYFYLIDYLNLCSEGINQHLQGYVTVVR